jgi:lipopolysaccharide biosynthesis regulator YciM
MTTGQFWLLVLVLLLVLAVTGLPWLLSRRREERPWNAAQAYLETIDALIRGQRVQALDALRRVAREESDNVLAYLRLGDLVRVMGQPAKAHKIHAGLAARPIDDPELMLRIRESLLEDLVAMEAWPEVVRLGERVRSEKKRSTVALASLSRAYVARGEWERAFSVLGELERISPQNVELRPAQARVMAAQQRLAAGEPAEARRLLEDAMKQGANEGTERILLGDVYAAEDDHERAAELWLEFAEAHPERAGEVFARLERSYYEMGKFGDLIEVYERLLEKTPRSPAAEVALADMHRRRGRPEEAIRVLQAALAADASHQEARRMLIECYLHSGQTEAALEEIDTLLGYHALAGGPASDGPGSSPPAYATRSADS